MFIDETDVLKRIDQDTLSDVIENDAENLDSAIEEAIDEMFGYVNARYDATALFALTGAARPKAVVMKCVDIALYHAHARISPDNIPELRDTRYTQAIVWCEKLADGFINPELPIKDDTTTATPLRYGNSIEKDDLYY